LGLGLRGRGRQGAADGDQNSETNKGLQSRLQHKAGFSFSERAGSDAGSTPLTSAVLGGYFKV
jgi:hypothetical protein